MDRSKEREAFEGYSLAGWWIVPLCGLSLVVCSFAVYGFCCFVSVFL